MIGSIRSARKQGDEIHQLRDDVEALRAENKELLERLDRVEAQGKAAT